VIRKQFPYLIYNEGQELKPKSISGKLRMVNVCIEKNMRHLSPFRAGEKQIALKTIKLQILQTPNNKPSNSKLVIPKN